MVWCSYVPLIVHDFKFTSDLFSQAKGLVLAHDGAMMIVELVRIQSKLIIEYLHCYVATQNGVKCLHSIPHLEH